MNASANAPAVGMATVASTTNGGWLPVATATAPTKASTNKVNPFRVQKVGSRKRRRLGPPPERSRASAEA
eukprot:2447631-Prymnesium_polylepis.1